MKEVIDVQDLLSHWESWQLIDVRSPGEFSKGHIPGAINIPLFTDEERARVGTLYKQKSPEVAFKEGLNIAGQKMANLVDAIKPYNRNASKKMLIHCWRGGKRSQAMQWLFTFSGTECARLEGGYKSFRTALQSFFTDSQLELRILGGCTGSGKTEVLDILAKKGEQVIDLEQLAHHKGSAFGSIGELEQPSTEHFENNLFLAFLALDPDKPIWLENESKSIGKVNIPDGLWDQMRRAVLYTMDVDEEIRLDRALKYYSEPVNVAVLKASFEKIRQRLGGLDFQMAIKALDDHDLRTAAGIALKYYDKSYNFQLGNWPSEKLIHLGTSHDVAETAGRLIELERIRI